MACARTINITCRITVDGVPEISVQDCAQAVAMATKRPKLKVVCKKSLFGCTLLLISITRIAFARTINVTCHSTVDKYRKTTFKIVHKPLLWQQNTLNYHSFVDKISLTNKQ